MNYGNAASGKQLLNLSHFNEFNYSLGLHFAWMSPCRPKPDDLAPYRIASGFPDFYSMRLSSPDQHPFSFSVGLPIDCDDEFWEDPDPTMAFKQPEGRPSSISGFIHILQLRRIQLRAMRSLVSTAAQIGAIV
jgi:hypothetical protein